MRLAFGPGPLAEVEPGAWSPRERLALALFAAALLATLPFLVHPWYEPRTDAAIYIGTAKSLLAGEGYAYLGMPFRVRPPGFSLLLAPVLAVAAGSFRALNFFVSLFGVGLVLALVAFARARIGLPLALIVGAAVWLAPGFQRLCNQVLSDVPGTALLLGCLLLDRRASRSPSAGREIALGLAIGLSAWVRSITILLVPAILLSRLLWRWSRPEEAPAWGRFVPLRLGLFAAVAFAALVPWSLRNAAIPEPGPADQTRLHSYTVAMLHRDPGDPTSPRRTPAEIVGVAPLRALQISTALGSRLQMQFRGRQLPVVNSRPLYFAVTALLLAALLVVGILRRAPAELFALGTLAVVLTYFGFSPRLMLPIWMLALPAVAELARDALARVASARVATGCVAAALVAAIGVDLDPRDGWDDIEATHVAFAARADAVRSAVPEDVRLASRLGFHWSVYLDRPVYSLQQTLLRDGRLAALEGVLDKYRIQAIVLTPGDRAEDELIPWVREHYGPDTPATDASQRSKACSTSTGSRRSCSQRATGPKTS
jgi:hypothetical protein